MTQTPYITPTDCAALYGGRPVTWRKRAHDGLLPGAYLTSAGWLIPAEAAAGFVPPPMGRPRVRPAKLAERHRRGYN